jgi:hypothetical protein
MTEETIRAFVSNARHLSARAVELVEPAGRVVYVGLAAAEPDRDRDLALKDVTAMGCATPEPDRRSMSIPAHRRLASAVRDGSSTKSP